ncbi:MAG: DUF4936 family protein [Rubrivivax sp.]|nr:DUF4936 family protein [Rubrivivax sp.]
MQRALFVYWHVEPGRLDEATAVTQTWQQALCRQHPTLQASLYRRTDADPGRRTLMESYSAPGGIDEALMHTISAQGEAATAAWRQGARHVEVFEALPQ